MEILKTYDRCITQVAKMSIHPNIFVELTADVVGIVL